MTGKLRLSTAIVVPMLLAVAMLPAQQNANPLQQQSPSPFGQSDAPPQTPGRDGIATIRTGVQLVVQDITVTDANGHPVTGLKPEDFHISEDGRPQTIKNFEEHAPIDPALAQERADALSHSLPPNTFTNYKAFSGGTLVVFLVDAVNQYGCGYGAPTQMHLRQDMIDYMKTVPLGTPFLVLQLDTRLHMIQDMTTDVDALRSGVAGKRDYPELPPELGENEIPQWAVALRRRQIVTAAMKDLERYLGAIPGKKNLIWFTGQLEAGLRMPDPTFNDVAAGTDPEDGGAVMYTAGRQPDEIKGNPPVQVYLGNIRNDLAQRRVALSIMRGTPVPSSPPICSYPNGKERIADIVDRGAHYYTLTYSPTNQNWNGRPRNFSVELADSTLHLDYRRSYSGALNDTTVQRVAAPVLTAASTAVLQEAAGASPTLETAMGMGGIEPTQIVFEASASPAPTESKDPGNQLAAAGNYLDAKLRKQGYRDYTVHFRVGANELKLVANAERSSYSGKLEFVAVVYDNQGQAVNGKREKVSVSFANLSDPELQTAELTGDLNIQVPSKGNYFLRLGVRDIATDRVGALEVPVDRIPLPK